MEDGPLSLPDIMNGGLVELFDRELGEVLRNIADPSTPAEEARTISFEVKFQPFADRSGAELEVKCQSRLWGAGAPKTQIYIGRDEGGKAKAWTRDPRQLNLVATGK